MAADPEVRDGALHALFAFEVGQAIDLVRAERTLRTSARRSFGPSRRAPGHLASQPAPLRVTLDPRAIALGGRAARAAEATLWDFGAASVRLVFPLSGPLDAVVPVAALAADERTLADAARRLAIQLVADLGPAVQRPLVAPPVEDYLVVQLAALDPPLDPARLVGDLAPVAAGILRAATAPLAPDEVADALASRLRFGATDIAIVDWNAALVVDPDGDEARDVLEYANVQLLELRWLDGQLDQALDEAYDLLQRPPALLPSTARGADLRRVGTLQADAAVLYERVANALKLIGDQYLSRLYRLVAARLHLADWDAAIARKLQTIDGIYEKLADRAATRRMEVLEVVIILLIAASIVLPFVVGGGH